MGVWVFFPKIRVFKSESQNLSLFIGEGMPKPAKASACSSASMADADSLAPPCDGLKSNSLGGRSKSKKVGDCAGCCCCGWGWGWGWGCSGDCGGNCGCCGGGGGGAATAGSSVGGKGERGGSDEAGEERSVEDSLLLLLPSLPSAMARVKDASSAAEALALGALPERAGRGWRGASATLLLLLLASGAGACSG